MLKFEITFEPSKSYSYSPLFCFVEKSSWDITNRDSKSAQLFFTSHVTFAFIWVVLGLNHQLINRCEISSYPFILFHILDGYYFFSIHYLPMIFVSVCLCNKRCGSWEGYWFWKIEIFNLLWLPRNYFGVFEALHNWAAYEKSKCTVRTYYCSIETALILARSVLS